MNSHIFEIPNTANDQKVKTTTQTENKSTDSNKDQELPNKRQKMETSQRYTYNIST